MRWVNKEGFQEVQGSCSPLSKAKGSPCVVVDKISIHLAMAPESRTMLTNDLLEIDLPAAGVTRKAGAIVPILTVGYGGKPDERADRIQTQKHLGMFTRTQRFVVTANAKQDVPFDK